MNFLQRLLLLAADAVAHGTGQRRRQLGEEPFQPVGAYGTHGREKLPPHREGEGSPKTATATESEQPLEGNVVLGARAVAGVRHFLWSRGAGVLVAVARPGPAVAGTGLTAGAAQEDDV